VSDVPDVYGSVMRMGAEGMNIAQTIGKDVRELDEKPFNIHFQPEERISGGKPPKASPSQP